jgi:hypothetical protein
MRQHGAGLEEVAGQLQPFLAAGDRINLDAPGLQRVLGGVPGCSSAAACSPRFGQKWCTWHAGDGAGVDGTSLAEACMPAKGDFKSSKAWAAAWRNAQREAEEAEQEEARRAKKRERDRQRWQR